MKKFWVWFFIFWPIVAIIFCLMAPAMNWWFPRHGDNSETLNYGAYTPIGEKIDSLFYLILYITTATFVGTQIALGYVLWKGATIKPTDKVLFTHGSHNLEVIWSIVPAGILLFIALYQMDVWASYAVQSNIPEEARQPVAEITARQFEWRIRYPKPGTTLQSQPQPGDLYAVNELHLPSNQPVQILLRTEDVQHAFFVPKLRVKKDAVPNLIIPIWFEVTAVGEYELTCAELCGWGHYKMKAVVVAEREEEFHQYLATLQQKQNDDQGVVEPLLPAELKTAEQPVAKPENAEAE